MLDRAHLLFVNECHVLHVSLHSYMTHRYAIVESNAMQSLPQCADARSCEGRFGRDNNAGRVIVRTGRYAVHRWRRHPVRNDRFQRISGFALTRTLYGDQRSSGEMNVHPPGVQSRVSKGRECSCPYGQGAGLLPPSYHSRDDVIKCFRGELASARRVRRETRPPSRACAPAAGNGTARH
jgi:hypothetical protein